MDLADPIEPEPVDQCRGIVAIVDLVAVEIVEIEQEAAFARFGDTVQKLTLALNAILRRKLAQIVRTIFEVERDAKQCAELACPRGDHVDRLPREGQRQRTPISAW